MLVVALSTTSQSVDTNIFLEVESSFAFNSNNDYRYNETDSTFYDVGTKKEVVHPTAQLLNPFASKKIIINGEEKSLFKRVHGVGLDIAAGSTGNIDFTVPYAFCKFTGANVFGSDIGDTLNFKVLDDATNTISGLDVGTYGANFMLNQFGFNVEMPPGGVYENNSNYDADLYLGMILRCEYTNNGSATKHIGMNPWLHEVK